MDISRSFKPSLAHNFLVHKVVVAVNRSCVVADYLFRPHKLYSRLTNHGIFFNAAILQFVIENGPTLKMISILLPTTTAGKYCEG